MTDKNSMTEGSIYKKIILFALPVLLGNLFQQLYNVTDAIVIGNMIDKQALAAVTSSGSLIFLLVGFVSGIFVGAGVVISRYFGAGDDYNIHRSVHTTVAFGLIMGAALTVIGIAITPTLLTWMGTPEDVFPNSVLYFRIYFMGALGSVMYNTCNGIYQAVGDSRHPLYYLMISSVLNVVLDIIFVYFWGIAGAAWATVASQFFSAVLSFYKLTRVEGKHRINVREIRIYPELLKRIVGLGLPTGVQNSVIAFANVIVQANINDFGSSAMAGCGSYSKLEGFAFLPITSFTMALTTFIGQNLGAKQYDRAKRGARFGIITGVLLAEAVGLILFIFAPYLIRIFSKEADVIDYGVQQVRTEALFYCLLSLSHCLAGILRGAGKSTVPMFVMLSSWCVIRIIYISTVVNIIPDIRVVFSAYPLTWFISSCAFLVYYFKADWLHAFDRADAKQKASAQIPK